MAVAVVGGLQRIHPVILALAVGDDAEILGVVDTPRSLESEAATRHQRVLGGLAAGLDPVRPQGDGFGRESYTHAENRKSGGR